MNNSNPFDLIEAAPLRLEITFPTIRPRVVYGLIAILVLIHFYLMWLGSGDWEAEQEMIQLYNRYSNHALSVQEGEYYRLFTSMFLHGDLTHLIFNCWALYLFGSEVESLFGRFRFILIYLLGGLAGSLASVTITQGNSIGASGAVFAVFGALVPYYYLNRRFYGQTAWYRLRQFGTLAFINLVIGFLSNSPASNVRIDNAAHIGGMVGGIVLAWFLTPLFQLRQEFHEGQMSASLVDIQSHPKRMVASILFTIALLVWLMAIST